jgi:hypothetical protein
MKKPLKETKFGKLLSEKLPDAIAIIGDVLPDNGVFGIAKNLIDKATLSKEDKDELLIEATNLEKEMFELEIKDRDSARNREIEIAKAGGNDHLMYVAGYVALIGFLIMIYAVIWLPESVSHNSLFHQLMGIIEGVALTVFGYYFGASKAKK